MTQVEYDIIVQCIKSGVPALSDKLILSLNNLVVSSTVEEKNNTVNEQTNSLTKTKNEKGEN